MREELLRMEYVTCGDGNGEQVEKLHFYILKGEVMGLISASSKGLGTLIGLVYQNTPIEFGRVWFEGQMVNHYAYGDGSVNKVYIIEERSKLIPNLSVEDNIFVLRKGFKKYVINRRILREQVKRLAESMQVELDTNKRVDELTPFERCVVELLKARLMGAKLVILLYLTNFIGRQDLARFHVLMKHCCQAEMTFLYVENHHQEVFRVADRAALYSGHRIVKVFEKDEMSDDTMRPYTISFDLPESPRRLLTDQVCLRFDQVYGKTIKGLSFSVRQGECLTLFDMDNVLIDEVAELIKGGCRAEKGKIFYEGRLLDDHLGDFLDSGIAVIPEDPTKKAVFKELTYMENLTFLLDKKLKGQHVKRAYLRSIREEYRGLSGDRIDESDMKALEARELYNLVYLRIHLFRPRLAVCVRPLAKGDMFCRRQVIQCIQELKNLGISVLLLTASISDCLDVSERLLIVRGGRAEAEYDESAFLKLSHSVRGFKESI